MIAATCNGSIKTSDIIALNIAKLQVHLEYVWKLHALYQYNTAIQIPWQQSRSTHREGSFRISSRGTNTSGKNDIMYMYMY